ncbi:MAG: DUF2249 domain-containing protein [Planctomycetia bacterium]|nr:DUF2249 domain-containing protein [Planctomycetia bacterium]
MSKTVTLDVRPTIQSGADPFSEIMAAVQKLDLDDTLQIINIFEPIPLINKLKNEGFDSWTERPEEGVVHTYFKKQSDSSENVEISTETTTDTDSFQQKLASFDDKKRVINVRQLEMPEPMVKILMELEKLPDDHVLLVEHKKIPKFLLPELKNRNYEILSNEIDSDHIQLLIYKSQDSK